MEIVNKSVKEGKCMEVPQQMKNEKEIKKMVKNTDISIPNNNISPRLLRMEKINSFYCSYEFIIFMSFGFFNKQRIKDI